MRRRMVMGVVGLAGLAPCIGWAAKDKDKMTAQQISDALSLANTLDQYNNNLLCT